MKRLYKCTKCGEEKTREEFGRRGKKRNTQCKKCVNDYQKSLRNLDKYNQGRKDEEIRIEVPIFAKEGKYKEVVQRTQKVVLTGEVDKFTVVICSCGLHTDLQYQHSFDQKNDYYEGECAVCGKTFKLNIVNR